MQVVLIFLIVLLSGCRLIAGNVNPNGPTGQSWGPGDGASSVCVRDPYRPGCEHWGHY